MKMIIVTYLCMEETILYLKNDLTYLTDTASQWLWTA